MTFTLNGRPIATTRGLFSYERLVSLAEVLPPVTVTYRVEEGESGILSPGDVIRISPRLHITVARADAPQ